ncbi:unnamed protein product [Heterobilharzia americana]|nr:unnamed protein product [Heterobilharzia americana]
MPESLSTQLSKTFYPINERVGASVGVISAHQSKHKQKHVVFTISLTKPTSIQVYLIKVTDKNELKKILLCNAKNLKRIDCRDTRNQPSYELQIITENKTWLFNAAKLEEKRHFIGLFCRTFATLLPHVFKDVELVNFPQDLNISPLGQNESLDVLLNPEIDDSTGGVSQSGDKSLDPSKTDISPPVSDTYRSLTKREEEDIRQFLDEFDNDSTLLNVSQLTERLQEQLAHIEGTNVHSIMASETQVLSLMTTLDSAIERAEMLEEQLNDYYRFLEEVEDAMSTLRDHDQLIQTTVDNRANLLHVLEELVDRLNVDPKYFRALMEGDLGTQEGIILCTEAALYLDRVMNSGLREGEEHLQAVDERMRELRNLRDAFAVKLSGHVNDTMLRFASQLGFIVNTGVNLPLTTNDSSSTTVSQQGSGTIGSRKTSMAISNSYRIAQDLYAAQRTDMLQLAPLIGNWLQTNRKDLYIQIKRMYVQKTQSFFKREIQEVLKFTQESIISLARPGKSKDTQRSDNISSDIGSVMSLQTSDSNILNQVESIFDNCFTEILTVIRTEQAFLNQFFGFNLRPPTNTLPNAYKGYTGDDELSSLLECMFHLFDGVEQDVLNLVVNCEQLQTILIMPLLITISRITENESTQQSLDNGNKVQLTYIGNFLSRLIVETKRAFNRLIERLIMSFKMSKSSRKARCGVLTIVRTYIEFAECSMTVFATSSRLVDLERAHGELIRSLMTEIDRVASESVKTPGEVVKLENYHRLCDILRRLKMSGLDEYRQDAKNRYTLALQEYTKNCMGRPLEKLAGFFENVQSALEAGVRPEVVSYQFAFSKQELRKVIKEYPGKEVKRGLESLCKKVEKHLSDEENLFPVVWRSIQTEFMTQCLRFSSLIQQCYPETGISLEFTITDLQNYFTEIARSR